MKIHTTQDLNSLVQNNQSTNGVSSKGFRLKNYSEQMLMPKLSAESADLYSSSISFGRGKKATVKDLKKIINTTAKKVGEIKNEPNPKIKRGDKLIENPLFNWILSKYGYEPVIQAGASALICMAFRPLAIMALPSKDKTKGDNVYAASHSFASGIVGLISAICLTAPFKAGGNYVTNVLRKNFSEDVLQRLYPKLNLESIYEKGTKVRKPIKEWLFEDGKAFKDNISDIQFLPEFKQLADVSDLTYKKILELDIDWAKQKGKSFNDVTLRDGSKLYDKLDMSKVGSVVKEDTFTKAQILLQDLDKEYLTKLISDSKDLKGSNWGTLDINSVYESNNVTVKDFRTWKDINGNAWKLDLDTVYIASPIEENTRRPRVSGKKRFDEKEGIYKFTTYLNNTKDNTLGTEVDNNLVKSTIKNEAQVKLLTWGPDIITRVPVAATTIALIPWTLKTVFGLEKSKKKKKNDEVVKQVNNKKIKTDKVAEQNKTGNVAFKGSAKDPEKANWFIKMFGKYYGEKVIKSEKIANLSEKFNKLPGELTQHMMTLGSFITSSVYMARTLQNKDLESDRRRTLAINQGFCFAIPTIAAYTVDKCLKERIKKFEYRVSNKMQYAQDLAKFKNTEVPKFAKNKANVKGIRILTSIGIFSLIYRFITPVGITPIANMCGEKWNARIAEKQKANNVEMQPQLNTLKEPSQQTLVVEMNSQDVNKVADNENNALKTA